MRTAKSRGDDGQVSGKRKRGKTEKDANKPKRPPSAFFVFMEEFRVDYKEKHPSNKLVSVVSKAGGDKWKSMSETDKAPYVAKAAKRKTEYEKAIAAYNKKKNGESVSAEEEVEGSDKSKSEVEDEDDAGSEEED